MSVLFPAPYLFRRGRDPFGQHQYIEIQKIRRRASINDSGLSLNACSEIVIEA